MIGYRNFLFCISDMSDLQDGLSAAELFEKGEGLTYKFVQSFI